MELCASDSLFDPSLSLLQTQAHPESLAWFVNLVQNDTGISATSNSTGIGGEVGHLMGEIEHQNYAGPNGFVVMWLKVEGFTALGLPLLSVIMMVLGMREHLAVMCLLFVVAVFQALWLAGENRMCVCHLCDGIQVASCEGCTCCCRDVGACRTSCAYCLWLLCFRLCLWLACENPCFVRVICANVLWLPPLPGPLVILKQTAIHDA